MRRLIVLAALAVFLAPLHAQTRELQWDELSVKAHLDAEGVLHIDEKQVMRFTGDWNGGERKFNIRPRQTLTLKGIDRITDGGTTALTQGDLGTVDRYDWADRNLLRWRSRDPGDEPFNGTVLTYVLHYSIANLLQRDGELYVLDHGFAFPDREGWIYKFSVELTLDPVWQPVNSFDGRWSAPSIAPGRGFVVNVPLRYTGSATPGADSGAPPAVKGMMAALLFFPPLLFGAVMLREKWLGRLDRLRPEQITREWLEQNLFQTHAEVVGALWDQNVGASEVSAMLARMVAEGKLESRAELGNMHLTLKVSRDSLYGHERALVDAMFVDGNHTSTTKIRKHYEDRGFDPAQVVDEGIKALAEERLPKETGIKVPSFVPVSLWLGAGAMLGYVAWKVQELRTAALLFFFIGMFLSIFALIGPAHWRTRKDLGFASALRHMIPATLLLSVSAYLVWRSGNVGSPEWPTEMQLGVTLLGLWIFATAVNALRSRESRSRIAVRKMLTSAREYFRTELQKPNPALQDAWFPYVLAFGLDNDVSKWFSAFAGADRMRDSHSSSFGSSSSSSSSSSGSAWTGGGGAFGGAGATGTWAAAASGMAAGVASPSSSSGSSGSSSSSGGSSGGGGGGGW